MLIGVLGNIGELICVPISSKKVRAFVGGVFVMKNPHTLGIPPGPQTCRLCACQDHLAHGGCTVLNSM